MTRYAYDIGAFCIDAIPNQPQVAHCHSFFVHAEHRGKGHGKALKLQQLQVLREQGFNFAQCTTAGDNERQHSVLKACGWKPMAEFTNSLSGGTTIIWGWEVRPPSTGYSDVASMEQVGEPA